MNIVVIPDGNRRWAKERGKDFDYGYQQLPIKIAEIIETLQEKQINQLYMFCNSIKNLARPPAEVNSYLKHFAAINDYVPESMLKVIVKGNKDLFPGNYKEVYDQLEQKTKNNTQFTLVYYVNYSTVDDLERAVNAHGKNFMKHLDEPDNIDLILRTGNYYRLSTFSPVKSPNAELMFVPEYFPDISKERIHEAIERVNNREINNGL